MRREVVVGTATAAFGLAGFAVGSAHAGSAEGPDTAGSVTTYAGAEISPDLVTNGSFESPQSPRAGLVGTFVAIPGWTETTGHGVEIQNGLAPAADGTQYVELDSRAPSRIYQDVPTVAGTRYRLTFSYAAHPGAGAQESPFEVTFGDTTQSIAPPPALAVAWQTSGMDVLATAKSTRLTFEDTSGTTAERGLGAFVDAVRVVALSG